MMRSPSRRPFQRSRLGSPAALLVAALAAASLLGPLGCAREAAAPAPRDPASYRVETLVPGMPFHGIHGLTSDAEGTLYVGSVVGQTVHRVDPATGEITTAFGPPDGCADDMELGPDGRLYWTQLFGGKVLAAEPGGEPQTLAEGFTGINSIAWKQDGRLFATEVFDGDALYEIDPRGEQPARRILANIGGLNGFDFGPDGKLYGPLWFESLVIRIDVDSEERKAVATGFATPAAANFDSQGRLYVLDTARGEVVRVDVESGEREVVATLAPGLDNLAFDPQDRLYVTNMSSNGIYQVDTETGAVRTVVEGRVAVPAGLDLVAQADGGEILHVADTFAYRTVDPASGEVTTVKRVYEDGLINPLGVAVGESRTLITFFFQNEAQMLDRASGRVLSTFEMETPYAAVALPGDRFLVTELAAGAVVEIDGDGQRLRTVAGGLAQPVGIALAGPGRAYVSEAGSGRLVEVELESGEVREIASGLAQPEGIDVSAAGNVVVAEVGAGSVSRIDPRTGERTVLASELPLGLPVPPGLLPVFIPTGVAVASSGVIYVSSDVESAVLRLVPEAAP